MKNISFTIFLIFILISNVSANEIIKDKDGNYFLIRSNGTFEKLPKPKPGNKYILKKKLIEKKIKRVKKKARRRTDTGFR
ncbi:MAG: hypothetical protein ACJ0GH_05825 [Alphaproteobacteria bacterium]